MGAGYWTIQPSEAKRLREYLLKGGFIIFDDFEGPIIGTTWRHRCARRCPSISSSRSTASPDLSFLLRHLALKVPHPSMDIVPGYFAMFENNDPSRRMIALANHNNDIAEYWESSAEGLYNPDPTSDAYRLGVNYYVYPLTH